MLQALNVANIVAVQLNKMAMRIQELEAENAQAKEEGMANVKGHKALIRSLQDQLAYERAGTHALVGQISRLETRIHGHPIVAPPPDVQLEHLMKEVEIAKATFGENSKEYRTKQKYLDGMLRAQAAIAERKAKEAEDAKQKK